MRNTYGDPGPEFNFPPYSTLPDITRPEWDPDPFSMIRLGKQGQVLYFVAVKHGTLAYGNPHYQFVLNGLADFDSLTGRCQSRGLVVEGGLRPASALGDNFASSYWNGGEGGLAVHYLKDEDHETSQYCFEPPAGGTDYLLGEGFSKETVATLLFARLVPTWHRRYAGFSAHMLRQLGEYRAHEIRNLDPPSFRDFARSRIRGNGTSPPLLGRFGYTYWDFVDVFEEQYDIPFEPENPKLVQFLLEETVGYMLPSHTPVHEATVAVNGLRDRLLAQGLKGLWDEGLSAFVPFGYTHGLTLKKFIETLGTNGAAGILRTAWRSEKGPALTHQDNRRQAAILSGT